MKHALAVSLDFFIRHWLYGGKPRPTKEQKKRWRQERRNNRRRGGEPDIVTTAVVALIIVAVAHAVWPW